MIPFEIFQTLQVVESDAASTSVDGVATPDSKPIGKIKFRKEFGMNCLDVDDDTYHKCIRGKVPFARWSKYTSDKETEEKLKKLYASGKSVLVKNASTGGMAYIKNKK